MKSLKLQELCVKTVCENTTSILTFINEITLPKNLILEIIKNYSKYRWNFLMENALNDNERFYFCLERVKKSRYVPIKLRNAVLCHSDWSTQYNKRQYCVWINQYFIENFNLFLCYSCYNQFKYILEKNNLQINLHTLRDHRHEVFDANEMGTLYGSSQYWCQNEFLKFLFSVKSQKWCNMELHPRQLPYNVHIASARKRFVESSDEDVEFSE